MPIKGLTDRKELSFPHIGSIRKGAPKVEGKSIGKDLTYFRAAFIVGEEQAAAVFADVYGKEPRELNIVLPFAEPERNWETWQEQYTAGALVHRCDGETTTLWRDAKGEMHHESKPCPGGCKAVGRLKVIIPELRRLAYIVVHTTSVWDIQEITRNLAALRALTGNGVNGIPLVLKRRPHEISMPTFDRETRKPTGKRARVTKWMLSIEADPAWVDRKISEMRRLATPGEPEPLALAEPVVERAVDTVTGEIVDGEPDWEEEGVYEDAKPEPQPEPERKPAPAATAAAAKPAKAAGRPIQDPYKMRDFLRQKAGWQRVPSGWQRNPQATAPAAPLELVQRCAGAVGEAIERGQPSEDVKAERHTLYSFIWAVASGRELPEQEVLAMLTAWEGEPFHANEFAAAECLAMLSVALSAEQPADQDEMPL